MNTKFFLAVLVGSIIAFFGGWLIFGVAFEEYYTSNTNATAYIIMKNPPVMWAILIGNIAWVVLITWILQKTGRMTFIKGFMTSLWVSFLIMMFFDLSMYGFWEMYGLGFIIVDIIVGSIFWGIVGGVSGAVLGSGKKVTVTA